jgi:hypothetical protein
MMGIGTTEPAVTEVTGPAIMATMPSCDDRCYS